MKPKKLCRQGTLPSYRFACHFSVTVWAFFDNLQKSTFSPDSEAIGVLASSTGTVACLHFGAGMLVPLRGAAGRCCCKVLLEGAAATVVRVWSGHAGAAAAGCCCQSGAYALERAWWCRCRMLLQGAAQRFGGHAGAAAVPLKGAA